MNGVGQLLYLQKMVCVLCHSANHQLIVSLVCGCAIYGDWAMEIICVRGVREDAMLKGAIHSHRLVPIYK